MTADTAGAGDKDNIADGDHGLVEERRHIVYHKVDWLFADRRNADEPRLPRLAIRVRAAVGLDRQQR